MASELISAGLLGARVLLEKQASALDIFRPVSWARRGALAGGAVGAADAAMAATSRASQVANASRAVAGGAGTAEHAATLAANKDLAALHDGATGKWLPFKGNASKYLRAYAPDAAKTIAQWAGSGALTGVAADAAGGLRRAQMLRQYGPMAAAGVGGLAAYSALKDR